METDAINGISGTIITYGQVSIAPYTYTLYPDWPFDSSTLVLLHVMYMCIHFFPQSNARCIATFQFAVYSHNLWCTYMINVLVINF